jgi:diguanylate cyclase (GGDEF)-like protein
LALRALARQTVTQLQLRATRKKLQQAVEDLRRQQETFEEYQEKLQRLNGQLQAQTVTDTLTGLYNRLAFTQYLSEAVAQAARAGEPLSLLILDVDRFKSLNDSFGYLAGDETLRRLAALIRDSARDADTAARYGGEEFAVILPATDENGARILAERLRSKVEMASWPHRPLTISAGVVTRLGSDSRCEVYRLMTDADAALHRAKSAGRNRVVVAGDTVNDAS